MSKATSAKSDSGSLKVAIVQAVFRPDRDEQLDSTLERASEAAALGAELIVFGETWLGGYPAWLDHCSDVAMWGHAPTKQAFAEYRRRSITVPGDETRAIANLAAEVKAVIVLGISERVDSGPGNRTLYNSLLTFDADGELINHHRKLVPTYTERLIWGPGDAHGLQAVDSAAGRVGSLVCWEHFMPLVRQRLHESGETIHVAVWPTVHEMHQIASRHYAFEGRCFVLAAGQLLRAADLPSQLACSRQGDDSLVLRGGSAIIGPDGAYVVEPVFDREEIVIAELDLEAIEREAMTLDVSGHYHRPDLFDFDLKTQPPRS